ncbi:MAG: hypothetical protein L6R41_006065 [Letrouitia leprolyta]|nr:MAG: hypothetical protein L6R41_006065 [Letrouitia leprolyta]
MVAIMKSSAVCFFGLVSATLASPLNQRREEIKTVTATVTVFGSSIAATYSSQPLIPVLSSDIPSLGNATASAAVTGVSAGFDTVSSSVNIIPTAAPTTLLPVTASFSSSVTPVISTSPLDSYPTGGVEDPCQAFCETVAQQNFPKDVCLENCQVVDGNAQINAPGVTFPPNDRAAAATKTPSNAPSTSSTPAFLTLLSIRNPAIPLDQCKEFCKSDKKGQTAESTKDDNEAKKLNEQKISDSTCLSNCQVTDGQVQVNAPGKAFPPGREVVTSSPATLTLRSSVVEVINKACAARCELGSEVRGFLLGLNRNFSFVAAH